MANGFLNGLVAYWDMDDTSNITDVHNTPGWDLQGALSPPTRVAGKNSDGADFANLSVISRDIVERADLNFRQSPMVSFTVSFWVKFNTQPTSAASTWLVEQYDNEPNGGWGIAARGQSTPDDWVVFYRYDASNSEVLNGFSGNINTGQWYHVAAGYDADNEKLFLAVDGSRIETTATNQIETAGFARFTVGGWEESGLYFSNAVIDELAVWSRALTAAEITQLYNSGSGVFYTSFDAGAGAVETGTKLDVDLSDPAPLFTRHTEVTGHLLATPRESGDAAITVVFTEEPL